MKKTLIALFLTVTTSVAVVSCSSSDDTSSASSNSTNTQQNNTVIAGKWRKNGTVDSNGNMIAEYNHECFSKPDYMEFSIEGRLKEVTNENDCKKENKWLGTYTVADNLITIYYENGSGVYIVQYKLIKNADNLLMLQEKTTGSFSMYQKM